MGLSVMKKEFGGYLPLELCKKQPFHNYSELSMIKCNSGLTSLFCAIKNIKPEIIYLPYFICNTVKELIKSMDINMLFYHINDQFEPIDLNIDCSFNYCIILVNYFGICDDIVTKYSNKYTNVIIDNTQSFFSKPVFRENVYNIYSCRKFIGVPDGGYLISKKLTPISLDEDYSSDRSNFLLKQIEYGINYSYKESKINYGIIRNQRRKMSVLTESILNSIEYDEIRKKRLSNFHYLHRKLEKYNKLVFTNIDFVNPYSYPLFYKKKNLREQLINNKIYVPTLWRKNIDDELSNDIEKDYARYICHLPIDQRYDENDMKYIAEFIINILEEK